MTSVVQQAQMTLDASGDVEAAIDECVAKADAAIDGDKAHWQAVRRYLEDNGINMPLAIAEE